MTQGTILWVDGGGESRSVVETIAREFGLAARFCTAGDLRDVISNAHPRVIGLELQGASRTGLGLLTQLTESMQGVTVLVAAEDAGVALMRAALNAGAADVLSLPLSPNDVRRAIVRSMAVQERSRRQRESAGETIAVCGVRGGLGTTTLAVNLAVRLAAATGTDAALVDLDLQRGDVSAFLNLTSGDSLAAFAVARQEADQVLLQSVLARHPSGVVVLPAPAEIEDAETITPADVDLALGLLREQFRFTVIDTPRAIGGPLLAAVERSDRILVLTDLSVPGVRAARRLMELLARLEVGPERIELVVTQAIPGPVVMQEATKALGKEPFAVIPRDDAAASGAMNGGEPLNGRQSGLTLAVTELAARLAGVSTGGRPPTSQLLQRLFLSGRRSART